MTVTIDREGNTLRLRCVCSARLSMRADTATLDEVTAAFTRHHRRCKSLSYNEIRRQEYRARREREGHPIRSCPMPPDPSEFAPGIEREDTRPPSLFEVRK